MDRSIFFKISSETDMNKLIAIINTAYKRLNILKILKLVPEVEVVVVEKQTEEKVLKIEVNKE